MKMIRKTPSALTAALLCLSLFPVQVSASEEAPVITQQPQNAEVSYPDGASFHIEVENPDEVASYQWEVTEMVNEFILEGSTAKTDTLVIPSTTQDDPVMYYRCTVTGKNGMKTVSDYGTLTVTNKEETRTVLFVGDEAVEPGETLDLADTPMGSGTIAFDANGSDVTFTDVSFDNSVMTYDTRLAPGTGMMLFRRNSDELEYHFNFVGTNTFTNTFYDEEYHSGGVDLNIYFGASDDPNAPTVILGGDGELILKGGSNLIYADSNIEIEGTLKGYATDDIFCDGIVCRNLIVDENAKLIMETNGTGVFTKNGDMRFFSGSTVDITSRPATVSVGATAKNILYTSGSVYSTNAAVSLKGIAEAERFVPNNAYIGSLCGVLINDSGSLNIDGGTFDVDLSVTDSGDQFAVNFNGIYGGEEGSSLSLDNGAKLNVNINAPGVASTGGIAFPGIISLAKDTSINVNVIGSGEVMGIECGRTLQFEDAVIESKLESDTGDATYGVVTGGASISITDSAYSLHSIAPNGIAFAADTGERDDEPVSFVKDYAPTVIELKEQAAVIVPDKGVINQASVPGYASLIRAETVYDPNASEKPAQEVMITVKPAASFPFAPVLIAAAAVLGVLFAFTKKKKA